jgi:2-polyprenyl-3-methyl-5-hydroxy-6-metoxy-1,4-benzoquinol methylase
MILDEVFRHLRWQKALKILKKFSGKPIVCDVGCGVNGAFLRKISPFIAAGFGLDKKVNFYKNQNIELKTIDLEKEKIPLEEKTIDIVTMLAVLEHLEDPNLILGEIFRILKPKGSLILTTPSLRAKPVLEFLVKLRLINKEDILEHKKYYSPREIEYLLFKSGFKRENINIEHFEFGFNILAVAKKEK